MKNISENKKPVRREFLFTASYTPGAVGVGVVVWPLIDQMNPDASVKAVSTTEVDIGNIELGKTISTYVRPTISKKKILKLIYYVVLLLRVQVEIKNKNINNNNASRVQNQLIFCVSNVAIV
jgi:Rieske Fe-S protein